MTHALKEFFNWDTGRTSMLGAAGFFSTNFDSIMGKTIAILTLALLLRKAWLVFVKGRDEK